MKLALYFFVYFIRIFLVLLSILVLLLQMIDLLSVLWPIVQSGEIDIKNIMIISMLNLPNSIATMLPFAVLFGLSYSVAALMNSNELLGGMTLGFSITKVFILWVVFGVFLSVIQFILAENIVLKCNEIRKEFLNYNKSDNNKNMELVIRTNYGMFYSSNYNSNIKMFSNVMIIEVNDDYDIVRRIDATRAIWNDETDFLQLYDVRITYSYDSMGSKYTESYIIPSALSSDLVDNLQVIPSELKLNDLKNHINYLKEQKLDYRDTELGYHKRYANSLQCFLLSLLSLVLVKNNVKNALFYCIAICFVFAIIFYITTMFMGYLGTAGRLNLALAAYLPYIIFAYLIISYLIDLNIFAKVKI